MIAALLTPLTATPPPCNIDSPAQCATHNSSLSLTLLAAPRKRLVFGAPNIVAGPPTDRPAAQILNGGPFWDKVRGLSATHALGNQFGLIATTDGGKTWSPLTFNDSCAACTAGTNLGVDAAPLDGFHDLGSLNITQGSKGNLTGLRSLASTRYFLGADGRFARELGAGATIDGLPSLRMLGWSGDSLRLADGSLVLVAKSILADGPARLSCVALRSVDGGFSWRYASVVAAAEEVPYAAEGPSEASLALLPNGTLLAVMRVEGQSGRYAPYAKLSTTHHLLPTTYSYYSLRTTHYVLLTTYNSLRTTDLLLIVLLLRYVSKLSDDGARSWHSLRPLSGGGSGGVAGAGCVRPRLLALEGSLVLTGGRPDPISRDQLMWLNARGDAEQWDAYSLSYWHNRLTTNANWTFPSAATNDSRSFPREDTSYNSIVRTGSTSGFVLYGQGIRSFTMSFTVVEEA